MFEETKTVFKDENAIEFEAMRNGEYRIVRIGKTTAKFILFVVCTMRGMIIRLISARQAKKKESYLYVEHKFKKLLTIEEAVERVNKWDDLEGVVLDRNTIKHPRCYDFVKRRDCGS